MIEAMQPYWLEFITIATVHLLAVASPGPDFAIVLRYSVSYGRSVAILASLGIATGILIHVAYSLFGIGLLIQTTPWLFKALTYVAAAYLIYLGLGAIKSAPRPADPDQLQQQGSAISNKKAFLTGLLTNGLNPKATLFFLSVFAVVVSASTPNEVKLVYGLYLALATGLWFCSLSLCLSIPKVRQYIRANGYWFDRAMGGFLILLAIKLLMPDS